MIRDRVMLRYRLPPNVNEVVAPENEWRGTVEASGLVDLFERDVERRRGGTRPPLVGDRVGDPQVERDVGFAEKPPIAADLEPVIAPVEPGAVDRGTHGGGAELVGEPPAEDLAPGDERLWVR